MSGPQWPGPAGSGQQFPPPGQPYGVPPGQPYGVPPGQPYGPPGAKPSRAKWWVLAGIAVAVVVAVVAGLLLWHAKRGSKAQEQPITASARDLLLTKSDFPTLDPAGKFTVTTGNDNDDSDLTVSPSECQDVLGHDETNADTAKADLDNSDSAGVESPRGYTVRVTKAVNPLYTTEFESIIDKCGTVTLDTGKVSFDGTLQRLTVTGTRASVNAVTATFTASIQGTEARVVSQVLLGVVRGTSIEVVANESTLNGASGDISADTPDTDAVDLFNKQVDKVENAK